MRESDIDQAERIATLRNDQRVREQAQQGTTFKTFADADTEIPGRFQSIAAAARRIHHRNILRARPR